MLIVNIVGLLLISLIIWWFWLYELQISEASDENMVITVENGIYSPARVKVSADAPMTLSFMRKDPSPCAETLVIPDLQISETLPLNKLKLIKLPAMAVGEYPFHCQMQMYRGIISAQ